MPKKIPRVSGIIMPRTSYVSVYVAPFTALKIEYYAPGCFRVLAKVGEANTYKNARMMLQAAKLAEA
jgi:hypothetical protein